MRTKDDDCGYETTVDGNVTLTDDETKHVQHAQQHHLAEMN